MKRESRIMIISTELKITLVMKKNASHHQRFAARLADGITTIRFTTINSYRA